MNDDNQNDTQQMNYCVRCDKEYPKAESHDCTYYKSLADYPIELVKEEVAKSVGKMTGEQIAIAIWNEAIEAAARVSEINSADDIRKLKK